MTLFCDPISDQRSGQRNSLFLFYFFSQGGSRSTCFKRMRNPVAVAVELEGWLGAVVTSSNGPES